MYCVYHKERAILKLEGIDTFQFLQGLLTNNLEKLGPGKPLYAFILTPQGRYQFDVLIFQEGERIYLDVAAATKESLLRFLKLYKLRSKVDIEEIIAEVWTLHGDYPQEELEAHAIIAEDPRDARLGKRMIKFSTVKLPRQQQDDYYEKLRLTLGIPKAGYELIAGKTIPLEARLEEHNGIDFNKGCYLGQELQARIKHQGLVRKNLFPVRLSHSVTAPLEESACKIYQGAEKVGTLTSYLDNLGIAKIRLEAVKASQEQGHNLQLKDGTHLLISRP